MMNELIQIFDRDLGRLKNEINAFKEDSNLWKTVGDIKNPAGNLCLHIAGNLNTYIGKNLGDTGYVRDRYAEFHSRDVAREFLIGQIEEVEEVVLTTLRKTDPQALDKIYPENIFGYEMTISFMLIHLATHLSYHLGQINYLRRVLEDS